MLIKEVDAIEESGINFLKAANAEEMIDKIVELPLRKACKLLRKKGIETAMSSANKNNILKKGEKRKEKEDVKASWMVLNSATFKDAGVGYAWIMLNFDTLSNENKDLLFHLEERKDGKGNPIGEKGIWFVHPFVMGNLDYKIRSGQINYEDIEEVLYDEDEVIFPKVEKDERLEKFENKAIILSYNSSKYPTQTVIIRMPIDEQTTVKEVEDYFAKFAENLKEQKREKVMEMDGK